MIYVDKFPSPLLRMFLLQLERPEGRLGAALEDLTLSDTQSDAPLDTERPPFGMRGNLGAGLNPGKQRI